jgi:hypothetical protein
MARPTAAGTRTSPRRRRSWRACADRVGTESNWNVETSRVGTARYRIRLLNRISREIPASTRPCRSSRFGRPCRSLSFSVDIPPASCSNTRARCWNVDIDRRETPQVYERVVEFHSEGFRLWGNHGDRSAVSELLATRLRPLVFSGTNRVLTP